MESGRVALSLGWPALAVAGLAGLSACSSGKTPSASTTGSACNPCDDGGGGDDGGLGAAPAAMNPDGFPYPSPATGYGRNARNGSVPGSIMRNFKFLGYPNGDTSMGLQTVQMADYYDPCQKRYSLIHLTVAAVWCNPCNQETSAIVAAKAQLDGQRVVILQALDDGPTQGTGATVSDLNRWVARYTPKFSDVLDPGLQNLGGFFPAAEVPWNCDIDPRT